MRKIATLALVLFGSTFFSSCYTYTTVVGQGAQGNQQTKKWNHYLIGGLAPVSVSDPKVLAQGAENYKVETKITFLNGLVSALTYGVYSPTTTTITK